MAAGRDLMFPLGGRNAANKIIPMQGVPYDFQSFHRNAARLDSFAMPSAANDREGKETMARAASCPVAWMRLWLHV